MSYVGRKSGRAALISADIPNDSITSAKIVADTILASDLADEVGVETTHHKFPVHANDAARNSAIGSPANGMIIYNTASNGLQQYTNGWSTIGTSPAITSFVYSDGASATAEKTVVGLVSVSCTTQTSTTVLVPGASLGIQVGMVVAGTGIPVGATVVSVIEDTSFVLSAAATASATVALTFGGAVLITGSNFDSILGGSSANIAVTFDGTTATSISVNAAKTIITCTPPAHAAGTITMLLTNSSGLTASIDFVYDEEAIFTTAAGNLGTFLNGAYTADASAPRIQATDGEGSPSALTTGFQRVTSAADDTVITTALQGLTLQTSGYLTGTLAGTSATTYPFYATAKDSQNQRTAPRLFNIIAQTPVTATGGNSVITSLSGYKIHVFTSGGTFAVSAAGSIDYLVVAGGGGVMSYSGGAGAGGVRTLGGYAVTAQDYVISIGAGGIAGTHNGTSPLATSGGNSTIVPASGTTITATGGGYAARAGLTPPTGGSGAGSGSGATNQAGGAGNVGGTLNGLPEGFAGGASKDAPNSHPGGGGGGAGGVGTDGDDDKGGDGGVGLKVIMGLSDADSTLVLAAASAGVVSGDFRYIAGGGGGGVRNDVAGAAGLGGGGIGSVGTANDSGAGVANTGGGAGGVGGLGGVGATKAGGSGIVVIRYAV